MKEFPEALVGARIFLHRANSAGTIARAAEMGIGIEVDVRSRDGDLFLVHDPIEASCPSFAFVDLLHGFPGEVILDFKESGLIERTITALKATGVPLSRCFAADLIVPDMLKAESLGLRTLARTSRFERIEGPFYGRWLDYVRDIEDLPLFPAKTFLVSPELHGYPLDELFVRYARYIGFEGVCTDFPERWIHDRHRHEQRTSIPA